MYPYLYRYGGFVISSYAFLYRLGVALAGLIFALLLRKNGYGLRRSANLYILAAVAVFVGGRILYGIVRWPNAGADLHGFFDLSAGGQILYGSVLLTIPALLLFARLLRMRVKSVFDAAAVGTPLGLAIGRIGCLCEGCCHGTVTALPWGVAYPRMVSIDGDTVGTPAYLAHLRDGLIPFTADRSLPVHPVQVYEAMAMGVVFLVLLHLWQRGRLTRRLAPTFVLSYCLTRFGLEFIRVQEPVLWGLTLAQILSFGIGAGAAAWLVLGREARAMHGRDLKDEPAGQAT